MPKAFGLPKVLYLKRKKLIGALHDRSNPEAHSLAIGCIHIAYRVVAYSEIGKRVPFQVGFSPGRRIKSSVRRNYIKRLLREAFRKNQAILSPLENMNGVITLMLVFRGSFSKAPTTIPHDVPLALQHLRNRLFDETVTKLPAPK